MHEHPNCYPSLEVYGHVGFRRSRSGLRQEPFVSGADAIIERLAQEIANATWGSTLVFSAQPFPGFQVEFEWRREEFSGNWYYCSQLGMEGWLCPALFKYFDSAPKKIYAQFRAQSVILIRS